MAGAGAADAEPSLQATAKAPIAMAAARDAGDAAPASVSRPSGIKESARDAMGRESDQKFRSRITGRGLGSAPG
jgi:hypothetical protein